MHKVLGASMDLWMSTQATECECDFVLEVRWKGVLTRAFPYLCVGGLYKKERGTRRGRDTKKEERAQEGEERQEGREGQEGRETHEG